VPGSDIVLRPIGLVRSKRRDLSDADWDRVPARIELNADFDPDALSGLEDFSHAEIIFQLDRVDEDMIERCSRHPRNNPRWPKIGIFSQRGSSRPNRLGATIVRIVSREGRTLLVEGLDAVDGTPVLDIKPVMREFLPRGEIRQPAWVAELMTDYWTKR